MNLRRKRPATPDQHRIVRPDPGNSKVELLPGELALAHKAGRVYVLQAPDQVGMTDAALAEATALRRPDGTWPDGLLVTEIEATMDGPAAGLVPILVAGEHADPHGRVCYLGRDRVQDGWILERIS